MLHSMLNLYIIFFHFYGNDSTTFFYLLLSILIVRLLRDCGLICIGLFVKHRISCMYSNKIYHIFHTFYNIFWPSRTRNIFLLLAALDILVYVFILFLDIISNVLLMTGPLLRNDMVDSNSTRQDVRI